MHSVREQRKYGYHMQVFARPQLMNVLLKHVPGEKVHWGKRILSTMQNANGAMVRVADGTTYDGDIIIGADGAYSAVRQSLYKNMTLKGLHVDNSDTGPLRFDQFAIVGVTKPLNDKYPILNEPTTKMEIILASRDVSYNVYAIPVSDGCLAWGIGGHFLKVVEQDQESFRFSEWGSESVDAIRQQIENIPVTIGGTIGEIMDASDNISKVMLEDKMFETWFEGRTALMGDAAHKLIPAGGQGGTQSILDAICLANLIHELPTSSVEDIHRVFSKYYELRAPVARKAVEASAQLNNLMVNQGWFADLLRSVAQNLPNALDNILNDVIFAGRPILNYIPPIPLKGSCKDNSQPHKLDKMTSEASTV